MKLNREALANCLRKIAPTIGEKTQLEQLKCFWFDGALAWTYNEVVATEVPFEIDIQGGIGAPFMGLVENSSAAEIDMALAGNELSFKAGGSKGTMSIRGMDEKIYPFPPDDAERSAIVVLAGAAEAALRHVNVNASESGVTLVAEDDELAFYSTDNKSISWARIPLPENYNAPRLLLSPQFCQRLQVLMDSADAVLEVLGDSVVATMESNARLFGRLTVEEHPRPFRDAILNAIPDDGFINVPEGIADAIRRVQVLVHPGKQDRMQVSLDGQEARFEFKSDVGHLDERFVVPDNKRNVEAPFDPDRLKTGFGMMTPTVIAVGERAFTMLDEHGFGYVVSASKVD